MLLMFNDAYVAEFANQLSAKKRPGARRLAKQLGVRVLNEKAKLQTREEE